MLEIPAKNLIANNSFERDLDQWQHWSGALGNVEIINAATNGKQAVRLHNQAQVFQAFPANAGDVFGFSGWVRQNSDQAGIGTIGLRFLDEDGNRLSDIFESIQGATFEFKDMVASAPANTAFVQVYAWADPGVTVDVDDLQLLPNRQAKLIPSFPQVNALSDADFEAGRGAWRFTANVEIGRDSFRGQNAARIPAGNQIDQRFDVQPGQAFSFEGQGKAERGTGLLGLRFLASDGMELSRMERGFSNATYETQYIMAVAPEMAVAVETFVQAGQNSTVIVDDLSFSNAGSFDIDTALNRVDLVQYPIISPAVARRGDVSCDGGSNAVDALYVLQWDVGLRDSSQGHGCVDDSTSDMIMNVDSCDVNGDGQCGAVDALMYLQCDVGDDKMTR